MTVYLASFCFLYVTRFWISLGEADIDPLGSSCLRPPLVRGLNRQYMQLKLHLVTNGYNIPIDFKRLDRSGLLLDGSRARLHLGGGA